MAIHGLLSGKWVALRRFLAGVLTLFCLIPAIACQWPANTVETAISLTARPWPAADALFHQDPRWLGADDAHSVDLENGRVLWLFGDTFIDGSGSGLRSRAGLIRNSIGIQTGSNPAVATMAFYWRQSAAQEPGSFFPESGNEWLWPGDGVRIGSRLLIFLMRIEPSTTDLGFAAAGWQAAVVENPDASPGQWQITDCKQTRSALLITLGSGGVLCHQGYLYVYGTDQGGANAYLARWPENRAATGDLRYPQWWCGERLEWQAETNRVNVPAVLFADAQTESGIHFEPRIQRFFQVQTIGFGAVDLGFRTAARPEGPWTEARGFYRPETASTPDILIYAAKSHPFLSGADLLITYATNYLEASRLMSDNTLYYPRFVKVDIQPLFLK